MSNCPPPGVGQAPAAPGGPTPGGAQTEAFPGERATWLASFTDPLTADDAVARLQEAINYGRNTWLNYVCGKNPGNRSLCPPLSAYMPNLNKVIQEAAELRDGFQVIVDKGGGQIFKISRKGTVNAQKMYQKVIDYGTKVFDVADEDYRILLDSSIDLSKYIPRLPDYSWIAKGALILGGLYIVYKVVETGAGAARSVRDTSSNIRHLVG